MKSAIIAILFLSFRAFSADTVTRIDANNTNIELSKIPQLFMATFVDQGFKQSKTSEGVWKLTINQLRCDYRSRDNAEDNIMGLPSVKCFVNAKPGVSNSGNPVQESRYLHTLLERIQLHLDLPITDCVMGGKCFSSVKKIECVIDTNKLEMHDMYSCDFTIEGMP